MNSPFVVAYQKTFCFARPMGRIAPRSFREIESPWGHDSFLLEVPDYHRTVAAFLRRMEDEVVNGFPTARAPGE